MPSVRFRVPGWCRRFEVKEGDRTLAATEQAGGWLTLRDVRAGAVLDLSMKAECTWREYPRNGGLSVERGPLTYSLAIEPQVACVPRPSFKKGADGILWPEPPSPELAAKRDKMTEMRPKEGTKWNYALDRTATLEYRTLPFATDCFRYAAAPAEILVKGRLLPEWTLQDNQPAELQDSPAYTEAPLETLRFIPMCCARLHVTVFPAATTDAVFGNRWHTVPAATSRKERSNSVPTR